MAGNLFIRSLFVTASCAVLAPAALAESWVNYNAVIRNNLSSIGDVEGAALVGGTASGNNIFGSLGTSPSGLTLGVGGNVQGNLNLNSGNARIGGSINGAVNNNGGGSISQNDGSVMSLINTVWDSAVAASSAFGALTANSTTSILAGNKLLFNAADNATHAVFDINSSVMSSFQEFVLQRDGADTIVINVHGGAGTSINMMATMNSFTSSSADIVWNFVDATSTINIQRQLEGSVLATTAHLNLSAVIEGSVAALSANMNGQEFHLPGFEGTPPPGTAIPLPSAALLGGAGLVAIGTRRRR